MNHYFLILILLISLPRDSKSEIKKSVSESEDQQFNLLILGGGYSASGNEVSLESNVRYLHRQKDEIGLSKFRTKTLFLMVWMQQETLNTETQVLQFLRQI